MHAVLQNRYAKVAALSFLLFVCAVASNAVMDTISFRYDKSVFSNFGNFHHWLDPRISWKNKWKNGDPTQGEAFILSSTALVATTDAWHFFKAVTIICVLLAIMAPFTQVFTLHWTAWIGVLVGLKLAYGLIFESLFAHFLIK